MEIKKKEDKFISNKINVISHQNIFKLCISKGFLKAV